MRIQTNYPGRRDAVRLPNVMTKSVVPKTGALPSRTISQNNTETLRAKLKSGQKLTNAELEYLKSNDPDLYGKALKAQQDREAYESSLRRCRTKSEVNALHDQTLMNMLKRNHNSDSEETMMRASAMQDSHRTFVQSDEYASLDWK